MRALIFSIVLGGTAMAGPDEAQPGRMAEVADEVSDAIIAANVRTTLLSNFGADALHIETEIEGGHVYLSGEVTERSSRELAPTVTDTVEGVAVVESDLTLADDDAGLLAEGSGEVADSLLEANVKSQLLVKNGASSLGVHVEAADDVVVLTGEVDNRAVKRAIRKTAKSVDGVSAVRDHTMVFPH